MQFAGVTGLLIFIIVTMMPFKLSAAATIKRPFGSERQAATGTTLVFTINGAPAKLLLANNYSATTAASNKLVIFLHYYGGTVNSEPPSGFVDSLRNNGYSVATLSAGNSWGDPAAQALYVGLYQYLEQNFKFQPEVYFITDSMGTLAALNILDQKLIPVRSFIGITPVVAIYNYYAYDFTHNGVTHQTIEKAYGFLTGLVNAEKAVQSYDPFQTIKITNGDTVFNGNNVPTYFLQGTLDPYMSWTRTMVNASLNQQLAIVPGGGHDTLVVTPSSISTMLAWMKNSNSAVSNAGLLNLSLSTGRLSPAFSPATDSYTTSVNYFTTAIKIVPQAKDSLATVKVNGIKVTSGPINKDLSAGTNIVTTTVTAPNGSTQTYTVKITRESLHETLANLIICVTRILPGNETGTSGYAAPESEAGEAMKIIAINNKEIAPPLKNAPDDQQDDGIVVHRGVSPNGDGINDFLMIEGITAYPDNWLIIANSNGVLVYETKGYDNNSKVFDGHSNKNGRMQRPGTYFYSLAYKVGNIIKHKTGFIVLKY